MSEDDPLPISHPKSQNYVGSTSLMRVRFVLMFILFGDMLRTSAQAPQSGTRNEVNFGNNKSWEARELGRAMRDDLKWWNLIKGEVTKEKIAAIAEAGNVSAQLHLAARYAGSDFFRTESDEFRQDQKKALAWYEKAAAQNSGEAFYGMAVLYDGWPAIDKHETKAEEMLKKSAELGYAKAQVELASKYRSGRGEKQNLREALKWYVRAAEQNHAGALSSLGYMYETGEGVPPDQEKAAKYYGLAIATEDDSDLECPFDQFGFRYSLRASARLGLDILHDQGLGIQKNRAVAFSAYRAEAEKGNAKAKYFLGQMLCFGYGISDRDSTEGEKWIRKSAEQGYGKAQTCLGLSMISKAETKDQGRAWLLKAAEQEIVEAFVALGRSYLYSATGSKFVSSFQNKGPLGENATDAAKWYRKAAERGNATALSKLIELYGWNKQWTGHDRQAADAVNTMFGEPTTSGSPSPVDSHLVKLIRSRAERGDENAQICMARFFAAGEGVPSDFAEAAQWYEKVAENDNIEAQEWLGDAFAKGLGATQDFVEAYKWLNVAAASASAAAADQDNKKFRQKFQKAEELVWENLSVIEKRDYLAARMTPEQLTEAQRRSREFSAGRSGAETLKRGTQKGNESSAQQPARGSGTGFFISADGFLVTNEHVARDASQIRLVTSAGLISAKVVKVDVANDLALLRAEGRFAALPVASSRGVRLGATVATVGFPNVGLQGFAPKLAKGEIASLSGAGDDARYFQISVPVQPGNSGGALVDERGNLVGVVSAKLSARAALAASGALPENVNYAVKSSYLLSFLESVPEVSAKLKEPETKERKFEDVVKSAEQAAVLVLVY